MIGVYLQTYTNGYTCIMRKQVCLILIVRQSRRREIGSTVQHWSLWKQDYYFAVILEILQLATNSKRAKVLYGPQEGSRGGNILIRSTEHSGERGIPFSTIGVNA